MLTLSASQVQAYLGCPLKYRFQYVDQLPRPWRPAALAFGSSVHAAIEWFHRERLEGRTPGVEKAVQIFELDWYAANIDPLVFPERESQEALLEKGREMLRGYLSRIGPDPPKAVEEPFEVELYDPESGEVLDVNFRGIVDLVEADDTLVDVKTAARKPDAISLERHLQLSIYALVHFLKTQQIPKLRLDVLTKTKEAGIHCLNTQRSLPDLTWTSRLVAETARAIEQGHFFPNPSWKCGECEFFQACQDWRG